MSVHAVTDFLAGQQLLTGMVGATLAAGALFALRQLPIKVFELVREATTTTLVIDSDDPSYAHVSVWLSRHRAAGRARRLMLAEAYDYDRGCWESALTLGAGWHFVMLGGAPLLIHRFIQDSSDLGKALGGNRQQRLTILSPGFSQGAVRALIEQAKDSYHGDGRVQVFYWAGGCYELADKRPKRSLDTVFLPEAQKRRLVDDLTQFLASRDFYRRRGMPWRRGVLLEGPPGTGKTTLIHVLAGLIGRSIYVVNLHNLTGDNDLIRAINQVGPDGVLVIEDIDAAKVTHDREAVAEQAVAGMNAMVQPKGVSLSGLLNAIDGVTAREGRILFITSNHADTLDPALLRAGRVDRREFIDRLGPAEAWAMFRAFCPDGDRAGFEALTKGLLPISAAELQNRLIEREAA